MSDTSDDLAFRIHGMDCADEVIVLEKELGPLVGGDENLAFDVQNGKMTVAGPAHASLDMIQKAVAQTGMRAEPCMESGTTVVSERFWERNRCTVLTAASGRLLLTGTLTHAGFSGFRTAFLEESTTRPPGIVIVLFAVTVHSSSRSRGAEQGCGGEVAGRWRGGGGRRRR